MNAVAAMALATALTVNHPDEHDMRVIVTRVRQHIQLRITGNSTPADAVELLAICTRLDELGANECAPHTVGGYAARYMLAHRLHSKAETLLDNVPDKQCSEEETWVWVQEYVDSTRDLLQLYQVLDPAHTTNGATPAAMPTLTGKHISISSQNLFPAPFPMPPALAKMVWKAYYGTGAATGAADDDSTASTYGGSDNDDE